MNIFVISSFLVFSLAVTFGATNADDVSKQIDKCMDSTIIQDTTCPDRAKRLECLKAIQVEPDNDVDANLKAQVVSYWEATPQHCQDCLYHCMHDFNSRRFHKEKEVCGDVDKTRECLKKLDDVCSSKVMSRENQRLDETENMCSQGYYEEGKCSAGKIRECNLDLFSDFRYEGGRIVGYVCGDQKMKVAKACMDKLKTDCNIPALDKDITDELRYIEDTCP